MNTKFKRAHYGWNEFIYSTFIFYCTCLDKHPRKWTARGAFKGLLGINEGENISLVANMNNIQCIILSIVF